MNTVLTPFPELLNYGILAPTLLRVAVGLIFAYLAYQHYKLRHDKAARNFPVLGDAPRVIWFAIVVEAATAAGFLFGYYTQYAAVVGAIFAFKNIVWARLYPAFFLLPRSTALLLLVVSLSLLLTGAGAFAFDLPL